MKHLDKILVIRFSSIGDIVLTSAVVRCLKEQLRDAEIHFLTKAQHEPILKGNPYIDKIWLYDHNFRELIPQLKSQGFNFIVDLHGNYRSAFVKSQLGTDSATFPKLNLQKWLTVHFKMSVLPDIHIVDRYFRAAAALGIKNDGRGLDYFIPPEDEVALASLPESLRQGFIAIVTGGKHNTKIFPPEKVAEVCKKLSRPVILLGGKEDQERGEQVVALAGLMVYNGCGLYNISQSASLIRQARSVMTNDTGLMHIAAAFKKPIVSVWGNTIPGFGMYPYLPDKFRTLSMISGVAGLSCRPCSKIGFSKCPKKHFNCMNLIETDPIVTFLLQETH
ncbi:MAG: glycosyltransferase family 9 protein [Bacteroidetes bacterium]|nr:glycosyltransferase family 9 protein [Bacteroidota bacterium]